jgi:hypothetical protein
MPLVRITVRDDTPPDLQQAISAGVHRAMMATIGVPDGDHSRSSTAGPATRSSPIPSTWAWREDWSFGNGEAPVLDTELLKRYGWTPPAD